MYRIAQAWKQTCAQRRSFRTSRWAFVRVGVLLAATICSFNSATAQVGPNGQLLVTVEDPPLGLTCEDTIAIDVTTDELVKRFGGATSVPRGIAVANGDYLLGGIDVGLSSPVPAIAASDYQGTRSGVGYCLVNWTVGLNNFFQIFFASFRQLEITVALNGTPTLNGPNGSTIDIDAVRFRDTDSGGAYATVYTPVPWDHWSAGTLPIELEFQVEFDLSAATSAGLHESTGGAFTITLDYL